MMNIVKQEKINITDQSSEKNSFITKSQLDSPTTTQQK